MQQSRSKTPWIVCGVIALVVVCGAVSAVLGGMGVIAYLGAQSTPTQAAAAIPPTETPVPTPGPTASRTPPPPLLWDTPTAEPTGLPAVVSGSASTGGIAGIPYKAVVQVIAMVEMDGEVVQGWHGSGSIITPDGLILTNAHVVLSDRYYTVDHLRVALTVSQDTPPDPGYIAQVMQVDPVLDIAVIRIETDLNGNPVDRASLNLPTVPFGDDSALNLGDDLKIIGYPAIGGSTVTVTNGEVSGFTSQAGFGNRAFIKTSATISGGNSGGLAANAQGELIGVPTQLGYGGEDQYVDCRQLADTNNDGEINEEDSCIPTGGFINALRPLSLAMPYIKAAQRGEINTDEVETGVEGVLPPEIGGTILFEDDFSKKSTGWDDDTWDEGSLRYMGGVYRVSVVPENWMLWSVQEKEIANSIIAVDTTIIDGTTTGDGDFGVICRYVDDANFYAFEVSEDGYYAIWKNENGEMVPLVDWDYSEAIPVGEVFRIVAACINNDLFLGVNDELLAHVTDDSFGSGTYGVIAGTFESGNFTVGFDNFTVYGP